MTGGTGSFGNAVVARLLKDFRPKKVVVMSRDEKKQFDMRNKYPHDYLHFIIGDVRDRRAVDRAMKGIDLVFHASALKQVPTGEFFPMELVQTNILGSHNVIDSAIQHDIEKIVILSTDKAVAPINVMGMTKALMEKIMVAASRENTGRTVLCGTRYGNVLYTRGSVVPFFVEQIKQNQPVTVTHGGMTRFMLPLDESVDLVLYALANGENGDIYVRKAPASTVSDIAKAVCEIFGHKQGIKEIGVRPGEKMHESLVAKEELFRTEDHGDYYRIMPESPKMDLRNYYFKGEKKLDVPDEGFTSHNTRRLSLKETKKMISSLEEIKKELKSLKNPQRAKNENRNNGRGRVHRKTSRLGSKK